jgi:hypothetical protein
MPAGRPSDYTPELANIICEAIATGGALYRLCEERDDFPAESTVYQWLERHTEFAEKYARARERQADRRADEVVVIADTEEDPQKARNRMDARKWHSSKLAPKKYGDRMHQEHSGSLTISHEQAISELE